MMNLLVVARSFHFHRFALHPKSRALSVRRGSYFFWNLHFSFLGVTGELSAKKCVPCDSKEMRPMTEELRLAFRLRDGNCQRKVRAPKLIQSWNVKSFTKGLEFFMPVGDVAEAEGHHPDLHLVGWNNVTIDIWTHAVGGLTENDFILAAKIKELELRDLLRRKD